MFVVIAPFHERPIVDDRGVSLPGAVENMLLGAGTGTKAGAYWRFSRRTAERRLSRRRSRAVVCRYSGVVRMTRPAPTAVGLISGAAVAGVAKRERRLIDWLVAERLSYTRYYRQPF